MDPVSPSSITSINRQLLFRLFFFGVFIYLLYQFLHILSPFVTALMGAVTLTLIFYPAHVRIRRVIRNPQISAAVSTVLILLIIVAPVILLAWLLVKEAAQVFPTVQTWMKAAAHSPGDSWAQALPAPLHALWMRLEQYFALWEVDLQHLILTNINQIGNEITAFGAKTVKNILFIIFDFVVLIFTLFFFLRDGAKMIRWVVDLVPMEPENKELILQRLDRTLSAVVRGVFITASTQGVLAGIGFLVTGVHFPVLLTFATAFMALIPIAGAASVWLPVAIYTLAKGSLAKGLFLLLWGGLVVSLVDNFLRPVIIGEKAKLPVLLLFLGILGGLQVYGFVGILVGPLMIASVMAFAKIYREQYHRTAPAKPDAFLP
jgi:predicted PurR-regulated permease PerM